MFVNMNPLLPTDFNAKQCAELSGDNKENYVNNHHSNIDLPLQMNSKMKAALKYSKQNAPSTIHNGVKDNMRYMKICSNIISSTKNKENAGSINTQQSTKNSHSKSKNSIYEKMKCIFKQKPNEQTAVNLTQNILQNKISNEEINWQSPKILRHCIQIQNRIVDDKRFDPFNYFGGFLPHEIETGIIRKIMKSVFAKEDKCSVSGINSNSAESLQSNKVKGLIHQMGHTSSSQVNLNSSKNPSIFEISQSLKSNQKEYKWNNKTLSNVQNTTNNSHLKHNHLKYKSIIKHKSALWSSIDSNLNDETILHNPKREAQNTSQTNLK